MTNILKRKKKLIFETPFLIGRRPMIVQIEAHGLRVRPKRSRHAFEISWAQIFIRAATIAAEAALMSGRKERNAHPRTRKMVRR